MKLTFLGTGTAHGVPYIGCGCAVCTSSDKRNRRSRTSALLEYDGKNVLIDTSPDLRTQVLENDIKRIDAILLTHTHADHLHGLDDIRIFNLIQKSSVPLYARKTHIREIKERFSYAFRKSQGLVPRVDLKEIRGEFDLFGKIVRSFKVTHTANADVTGYRIENFAYITDCKTIPKKSMEMLTGLEVLVINALRYEKHDGHFNLEEALALIDELKPKRAYLTHMSHEFDYEKLCRELPANVRPAYDGLSIEF